MAAYVAVLAGIWFGWVFRYAIRLLLFFFVDFRFRFSIGTTAGVAFAYGFRILVVCLRFDVSLGVGKSLENIARLRKYRQTRARLES